MRAARPAHPFASAPVDLAVLPVSHKVLRDDPIEFDGVVPARDEEEEQQLDNEVDRVVGEINLAPDDGSVARNGSNDMRCAFCEGCIGTVGDHHDGGIRVLGGVKEVNEALRVSRR